MSGNSLVRVRAAATVDVIHPGETFHLALTFQIEPAWHIYWINPGETGSPTGIFVDPPEGFDIGPVLWPRPQIIPGPLVSYGYEDEVTLFVPVTAPDELPTGEATFPIELDWLVCKEQCLMGDGKRSIRIATRSEPRDRRDSPYTPGEEIRTKDLRLMYDRIPESLQGPHAADESVVRFDGETLMIEAPAKGFATAGWLPVPGPGVTFGKAEVTISNDRVVARVPVVINERAALGRPMRIEGVLTLGERPNHPAYHVFRPVNATNPTN